MGTSRGGLLRVFCCRPCFCTPLLPLLAFSRALSCSVSFVRCSFLSPGTFLRKGPFRDLLQAEYVLPDGARYNRGFVRDPASARAAIDAQRPLLGPAGGGAEGVPEASGSGRDGSSRAPLSDDQQVTADRRGFFVHVYQGLSANGVHVSISTFGDAT